MRRNDTGASWIIRAHLFVPISLLAFLVVGCARSSVADRPTPTVPTATLEPTPTVPTATLEPTPTPLSTASRAATPTIESSPTAAASETPQSRLSPTTTPIPTVFQFSQTIHATVAGATNQPLGAEEVTFVDQMHGWLVAGLCYSGDCGVFATSDGGKSWSLQYRTPLSLEAPFFTDLNHGWIAANDCTWPADARPCSGSLLRTVDGGHSWTVDRMPNPVLQDLKFVNPTRGWAIASNCSLPDNRCLTGLLATRDAGRSWQDVSPDHRAVLAVAFVDEKYGWIVACAAGSKGDIPPPCTGQQVLATTDGGNSWTRQFDLPDSPEPFHAYASFVDRQNGWILATRSGACTMGGCWGPLYHTSDGGLTWNLIPWNIRSVDSAVDHGPGFPAGVHFASRDVGWIPIDTGAGGGAGGIARTNDGGKTWERQGAQNGWGINAVSVVSDTDIWIIGGRRFPLVGSSFLLHTQDSGATWIQILPRLGPTDGIDFVDTLHGIGIGDSTHPDVVLASNDGTSWMVSATIANTIVRGVSFVDRIHGWAIGQSESNQSETWNVFQTVDGGKTWRLVYTSDRTIVSIRFFNPSDGILVLTSTNGLATVATTDGGQTWTPISTVSIPKSVSEALTYSDRIHGWAAALSASNRLQVLATSDGGASWVTLIADLQTKDYAALTVASTSGSQAWVGFGNRILSTVDGGQSWTDVVLPADVIVEAMSVIDQNTGWLMSVDGRILRTTNGGKSWSII